MKTLALFLTLASASNVKFQSAVSVAGWHLGERSSQDLKVHVMIALKNRNMQKLEEEVLAVSSPQSERYGQHLSSQEVAVLTGPDDTAKQVVGRWLSSAGIEAVLSRWGDRFEFKAMVGEIEDLFSTEVHILSDGAATVPQAGDLHAPQDVSVHIEGVFGLHGIPVRRSGVPISSPQTAKVTPELLRQVYNVTGAPEVRRGSKNKRAVVEFQNQFTKQEDLTSFFKQYVPSAKDGDDKYTCGVGPCEPQGSREHIGTEAMLDLEYIMGPVPGVETEVWVYAGAQFCTDLKNWTTNILDRDNPPLVFSISYGVQGNVSLDKTQGCSMQLIESIEADFAKIAARGISLIFSSGDSGSGGTFLLRSKLWPVWPGSAAYTTTVGATQFNSGSSGQEIAVKSFGSGGGFDWRVPLQSWQQEAANSYLAQPNAGLPKESDFHRGGRASPEVSALGLGYQVVFAGRTMSIGGTSASAPFFAALVSLLNEVRLQQSKSPLGFLSPLIYEMGKANRGFRDITVGNNRKDRSGIPTSEGYSCTQGWDAVTGWGTPDFYDMLEYVRGLPSGHRSESIVV